MDKLSLQVPNVWSGMSTGAGAVQVLTGGIPKRALFQSDGIEPNLMQHDPTT